MADQAHFDLKDSIEKWRRRISAQPNLSSDVRRELDAHLLDAIAGFQQRGLNDEESFVLACHRVGQLQQLGDEFVKVGHDINSKIIWNLPGILSFLWMIGGFIFIRHALLTNSLQFSPLWLYLLAVFYGWLGVGLLLGITGVRRARITGRIFGFCGIGLFVLVTAFILYGVVGSMHQQALRQAAVMRQNSSDSYDTAQQTESSTESNSVIGLWRSVKLEGGSIKNSISISFTNPNDSTYICFETNGFATFTFRDSSSTNVNKVKFAIFGSDRLVFGFSHPPGTVMDWRATQYRYHFVDGKLRMIRPALWMTNTYERVENIPF